MPKQSRIRQAKSNPFTKALEASDAERHDETNRHGNVVSLGQPKQTGALSTVKPDNGGPSQLETARNLVRRAGDALGIGVITRLDPIDDTTAILVFQASDRRVVTTPNSAPTSTPAKEAVKEAASKVAETVKNAVGTNPSTATKASAPSATHIRERSAARR
ncbi:MAG: hypothetical protein ACRDUW_20570, partial [Pseudonocardiaceae bacterium]